MSFLMGIVVVVAILFFVFEMLRRQKLREKYAVLWIIIGLGTLLLAAFPRLLELASTLLGIQVPANLLFIMTLVLLVGVCLHLSQEQSQAEDEVRILAEEVAILRSEVENMKGRPTLTAVPTGTDGPTTP
ncbi:MULTISPECIES: DUF2304 domain-containing protein [unclassified Arthrobacter]|uniref:DUF2304 domain-containing protein n=1 Tax=unclassified Arthrobacter TaxID=235627 RepID=UPI003394385D